MNIFGLLATSLFVGVSLFLQESCIMTMGGKEIGEGYPIDYCRLFELMCILCYHKFFYLHSNLHDGILTS